MSEVTSTGIEPEVEIAENQKSQNSGSTADSVDKKPSVIDKVVDVIGTTIGSLVKTSDRKKVERDVFNLLCTLFTINSLGEYEIGLRIGGELYRFNEYKVPAQFANLMVPARITLFEEDTAINFAKPQLFKVSDGIGKVLTPGELIAACKRIGISLRVQFELQSLSRPQTGLLSELAKYVVSHGKVQGIDQDKICFLTINFDESQDVKVEEWCKHFATSLIK